MSAQRLPHGGRIERATTLPFTWDGKPLCGHPGDTLASALMANDVHLIGRSFKYHRPRGIMSAGVEESGALVTIGEGARRDANVKATTQELYAGLVARGQNAFPNVRLDVGALSNVFSRFLAAGFYYKTFMGPRLKFGAREYGGTAIWMLFEKMIRHAAGMGAASRQADPDSYEHGHDFCDVLVVGGGPAGLAAAAKAARAGLEVVLVEQDYELGGNLLSQATPHARQKLAELLEQARAAGVRSMTRATVFGLYDCAVAGVLQRVTDHLPNATDQGKDNNKHPANAADNNSAARACQPRQRFWTLRAKRIIVASGALERCLAFGNNDRPGVMTAAAGQTYLNRYGILPGRRIVVAANNDSAYPVAAELARAGAEVMLLDARRSLTTELRQFTDYSGVTLRMGCAPLKARGGARVKALELAVADGDCWLGNGRQACDLVLVSGGWSPVINLLSQRGAPPQWNAQLACFLPPATPPTDDQPLTACGAAAGIWDTAACQASGTAAAVAAINALGKHAHAVAVPEPGGWQNPIRPLYEIKARGKKLKSFVDAQHDVTTDDVRLAQREGFVSVEHLKRYTTIGMATDGGKVGNVIALALMAEALGKEIPQLGTTTFRPPYTPVSLGALRGRNVDAHFRPLRRTPMHQWNLNHRATMTMAGLWHRPWYFAQPAESLAQAYVREATSVRNAVGLCDVTSLGKIALQGPDTAEFLNRVYANRFAKLAIGKARYGIMLRDDGIVMDDGTTWRLSACEYFMTTTTAHAAAVMAWLEQLLQTRWCEYKVQVTSVSDQWAGCAVAGPQSRAVLSACVEASEQAMVSAQALPFMGVVETTLRGGIACRIARISFSGEMAYEVYVPSDYAAAMMDLLWDAVKPMGGCLYGLEALSAMRIEKGHVTAAELDGRVTMDDVGLGGMLSPTQDFIGAALRNRPALRDPQRPQLVGLRPVNRNDTFNAGAILCDAEQTAARGMGEGWVTAVTHSPACGHWLGLGFIRGGQQAWRDKAVLAADPVRKGAVTVAVEVIAPRMFDPRGERMHG